MTYEEALAAAREEIKASMPRVHAQPVIAEALAQQMAYEMWRKGRAFDHCKVTGTPSHMALQWFSQPANTKGNSGPSILLTREEARELHAALGKEINANQPQDSA